MTSFADSESGLEAIHLAVLKKSTAASSSESIASIFLMVNSLETGGTERQFVEISRSLIKDGFRVHLGCLQRKGSFLNGLGELHLSELGGSLYGVQSFRSRWHLARHLREMKVVVAHAFDFYANLMLIPAAKLAAVPVVIGSHRQIGDLLRPAQFRAQLGMFFFCDRVVCNSYAAADRLARANLPERKLVVVGNGLPREAFQKAMPALALREGIHRVGMIARMNAAYKNHSLFLRAAARLVRRLPNVEFVLVGDGPLRADLEHEAAALGLQDRSIFMGDRRDIPAVLAGMDVSVVPSTSESLSNVMLESMAAGIPVVATAVGGNIELGGGERAILVPPGDEEALAAAMERILQDRPLRSTTAHKAQEFAQDNFSIEHVRDQYLRIYSNALAARGIVREHSNPDSKAPAKSPIRVAIVAPTLRYVGGQSVQADLLIKNWNNDPEVEARLVPIDPRQPNGLGWIERVPALRTLVREPQYFFGLWRSLRDADVAHVFSASYSSFLLAPLPAWIAARQFKKKILIHYHSGECRDHLRKSSIARRVLRKIDRLIVPSGYLVDVFAEFGLNAQAIPNIVDLSHFLYRARRPLRPHLVCTRGFHPYYCIDLVVRAFAEVQQIYPEALLDLVGTGPAELEIGNLVREMKLGNVNFAGVASRSEIGGFYDRADIFINASRLDNMPVSILEAFASGTPVVSTEPEGMRYLVEHGRTGLLSPPGNWHALAQNIIHLLQNPDLAERLAANAQYELRRYSWPIVREQWLTVYRRLMSREVLPHRSSPPEQTTPGPD